jgi:RHS repeat-associated protein
MPRLSPLWPWSRVVLTRAVGVTLVLLGLVAPHGLLAATSGSSDAMPSVGMSNDAISTENVNTNVSSSMSRRTLDAASTSPGAAAARRDSAGSASRFIYVNITHAGNGSASVYTDATGSTSFTVTNTGYAGTVLLSATDCTGSISNCSASPAGGYLSAGSSMPVTVTFTGGPTPGTGWFTLKARDASDNSLINSYTVSVTTAGTIDLTPHVGDRRDVSQCVADCFESTFSYTTPAYFSHDVPRSVTLLYRSGRAYPHGNITLDVADPDAPASFKLRLRHENGAYVTFTNGQTSVYVARAASGTTRLAAQFNPGNSIPTSAKLYTVQVTSVSSAGIEGRIAEAPVRIIIINDQVSPFGAGVDIVGLQRLFTDQSGGVLLTDGTGSASFFSGNCSPSVSCTFTSPAGDFSVLTTGGSRYQRTYPDGTVVTFDAARNQLSSKSRFGDSTYVIWGTNAANVAVPTWIVDPAGQTINFNYYGVMPPNSNQTGSLANIVIQGARVAWFGVWGGVYNGTLLHLIDVDGQLYGAATYDTQRRLIQFSNKAGDVTNFAYSYGKTIKHIDLPAVTIDNVPGVQPRTQFREAYSDLLRASSAGQGYDLAHRIPADSVDTRAAITDPGGHSTTFGVDRWNQPITITDALNRTTTITRDAIGRAEQIQYPTGAVDQFRYSGTNLVMSRPAGADSTNYRWSTRSITPAGSSTPITITVLDSTWGPRQPWQQIVYATNGAVQSVKSRYAQGDPTIFTTTFTTDSYGRVLTSQDNANHVSRNFYNGRYGNRDSTVSPGGQYTKTVYDIAGRDSLTWTSGRSKLTPPYPGGAIVDQTLYDAMNRVVSVSDGMRPSVKFEYGPIFLNKVRHRAGQVFRRDYNSLGWLEREYDPADTTSWSRYVRYEYDVDGQLKNRTNRRGQVITTMYDVLHRPTSVSSVSGTDNFGYSTDGLRSAAWNGVSTDSSFFRTNGWQDSTVTRIGGQRFRTTYLPDASQRLDSIGISMGWGPITFAGRKYIYDPVKNVLKTILINSSFGATLQRTDDEGLLNGITYLVGNSAFRQRTLYLTTSHQVYRDRINPLNTNYYYDAAYGYDSLGRLKEWTDKPEVLPVAGRVNTFAYDGTRLEQHRRFSIPGNSGWPSCPTPSAEYGYNCASLSSYQGAFDRVYYGYDNAENRTSDLRQGGGPINVDETSSTSHEFDPGDRIKTISGQSTYGAGDNLAPFSGATLTFERDLDGNLTRRFGASTDIRYGWDARGKLTSVTVAATGSTVNYDYNAMGQLVRRRTNGTVDRHFLWEGDNLLAELNGAATERIGEYVNWGLDQPLAILTGAFTVGAVDYHVQDALGNVKLLFNQTSGAPIDFQTEYSDWGTPVNTTWGVIPNRMLFKGMFYEGDSTKLYYARNRWYSPEFGGFMSEDPLSIGGGLNMYAFAGGDPINRSDPYGLDPRTKYTMYGLGPQAKWREGARKAAGMGNVHSDPFGLCSEQTKETQVTAGPSATIGGPFIGGAVFLSGGVNVGLASSGRFIFQLQGSFTVGLGAFVGAAFGGGVAQAQTSSGGWSGSTATVGQINAGWGGSAGASVTQDSDANWGGSGSPFTGGAGKGGFGYGAQASAGKQGTLTWASEPYSLIRRALGNKCRD